MFVFLLEILELFLKFSFRFEYGLRIIVRDSKGIVTSSASDLGAKEEYRTSPFTNTLLLPKQGLLSCFFGVSYSNISKSPNLSYPTPRLQFPMSSFTGPHMKSPHTLFYPSLCFVKDILV
jgi:hypothetical protein